MPRAKTDYQNGPLHLHRRGGIYQIKGTVNGERIRVSAKTTDLRRAKRVLDELLSDLECGRRPDQVDEDISWERVAKLMCARHRVHSRARSIPFMVTSARIYGLMRQADFRCAVSGIPLSRRVGPNAGHPDPWAASIDRIEGRHGYVKGNVRVVCLAANLAMNRWGFDVLLRLANAVHNNATRPAEYRKGTQNLINLPGRAA